MTAPVFAHQGGWDEILLVVAPLALIGLLLWVANRRLAKQLEEATTASTETVQLGSSSNDSNPDSTEQTEIGENE